MRDCPVCGASLRDAACPDCGVAARAPPSWKPPVARASAYSAFFAEGDEAEARSP